MINVNTNDEGSVYKDFKWYVFKDVVVMNLVFVFITVLFGSRQIRTYTLYL